MNALRIIDKVQSEGTISLQSLPLKEGQLVEIIVLPIEENDEEWNSLADAGLSFWNNDADDRAWNHALPPT